MLLATNSLLEICVSIDKHRAQAPERRTEHRRMVQDDVWKVDCFCFDIFSVVRSHDHDMRRWHVPMSCLANFPALHIGSKINDVPTSTYRVSSLDHDVTVRRQFFFSHWPTRSKTRASNITPECCH